MKRTFPFLCAFLALFCTVKVSGQGCSDAGFCTLNSFKPNSLDSVSALRNQFKVGASFGTADYSISVFGAYLEYNRQLGNAFAIDAKLTTLGQTGNDISVFGLSDVYLNATYQLSQRVKVSVGAKLPLTNGNTEQDGRTLPLDYQSSLGTFDLIAGFSIGIRNLEVTAAVQQPLTQNNNQFLAEDYPVNSVIRTFQSTNQFQRSGDALLRLSYPIAAGNFKFTPSVLTIYHLANDKFTDALGTEREIDGSSGLTLNVNAYVDYELNESSALQFNIGVPLVVRESRPDGLTRALVANLEYRVRF